MKWNGYVIPKGPPTGVQQVVSDTADFAYDAEFACVYADESFAANARSSLRGRLMSLQNVTYAHLQPFGVLPRIPFFVSLNDTSTPVYLTVKMQLLIDDIKKVPDTAVYISEREGGLGVDGSDPSFGRERDRFATTRLPVDCYLPGMFTSELREAAAVYRIKKYFNDSQVLADLVIADESIGDITGRTLSRTAVSRSGQRLNRNLAYVQEVLTREVGHCG